MKKGKLITLYGVNNIGKSTQAKILIENLKNSGFETVYVKYPVYDIKPSGLYLNEILRNSSTNKQKISEDELQMWFTINRYQFEPTLEELLNEGKIVVAEDYTGTGLAWGSAKGLNLDWLSEMNKFLRKEDLAIYLKGKRNMLAAESKHIHESNSDLMDACQFVMDNLSEKLNWHKVTVKQSIGETSSDIWNVVKKFLAIDGK